MIFNSVGGVEVDQPVEASGCHDEALPAGLVLEKAAAKAVTIHRKFRAC